MELGGYEKSSGKRSGGIRSIKLASVNDITDVVTDNTSGICTGINFVENGGFSLYEFMEGEASYSEKMSAADGVTEVEHEIKFSLERPDNDTKMAINELLKTSHKGIVAVVTTNSNVSFLVGYSDKFGTEQPLRLEKTEMSTGTNPANNTSEIITLVSKDDCKSMVYDDSIAV